MSLVTIPNEILREILMELNLPDVLKICSSNRQISLICNSDTFWKQRLERDYPLAKNILNIPYKNFYIGVYQIYKKYITPIYDAYRLRYAPTLDDRLIYYISNIKIPLKVHRKIDFDNLIAYNIIPDIILFSFRHANPEIKKLHPDIKYPSLYYMMLYRPPDELLPMAKLTESYKSILSKLSLRWKYELVLQTNISSRVKEILDMGYIISDSLVDIDLIADINSDTISKLSDLGLINLS
jgi:hypothetical protein